jgi:multiple sugar transport system permease protein
MRLNYLGLALRYAFLIVLVIVGQVPILLGALTAFKPPAIWVASPPVWIFTPTLQNFSYILFERGQLQNLINSLIITICSVGVGMLVAVPAAYSFARFRFRGSQALLNWLISLRMIPPVVVAVPLYALFYSFHLRNTYVGLTLAYLAFAIPLIIWIMRGYFADLPPEMEECAMADGCSRLEAFRRVVLPVVMPGIVATALLSWIFSWNEYLMATMLSGRETQTLPVAAAGYVGLVRIEWGPLFAINLIIMVPVVILALLLQRHLVRGLTFGMLE